MRENFSLFFKKKIKYNCSRQSRRPSDFITFVAHVKSSLSLKIDINIISIAFPFIAFIPGLNNTDMRQTFGVGLRICAPTIDYNFVQAISAFRSNPATHSTIAA